MNSSSLYEASSEDSTSYINKKTNKIKRIMLLSLKTVTVKIILFTLTHKQSSSNDLLGEYSIPLNGYLTLVCGNPLAEANYHNCTPWPLHTRP